jgi:hypothetical protein
MRQLLLPLLLSVVLFACSKKDSENVLIIEPAEPRVIEDNTISTGNFWNIGIDQTADQVYSNLQAIAAEKKITFINVAGNTFTNVADLETRLTLYRNLFFDEVAGTSTGIQLTFENDKIKSIYLNSGVLLYQWPAVGPANAVLKTGDGIASVYTKLTELKDMDQYKNKLGRMLLLAKKIETTYDTKMSTSPQWTFVSTVNERRYYIIELSFQGGKLSSVHYVLYEKP